MNQNDLIKYCDEYLEIDNFHDYCPNGLQVEGDSRTVQKIALGVSISLELIEKALALDCDLILTHHGLIWNKDSRLIEGPFKKKLQLLLSTGIAAAAYHLPLDTHPEVGNNIQVAQLLEIKDPTEFKDDDGDALGVIGDWQITGIEEFGQFLEKKLNRKPLVLPYGKEQFSKIAIVTGGAQDYLPSAFKAGADCYITGEASEKNFAMSKEYQIHFISAGHYQTEKFGIQALGEHLNKKFDIQFEFIDIPNPI
jgi:dinuclear metal center YbgI/SA1388 family protein